MEYKIRCVRKKKAHKIKNREDAGFVRIKVRGRKRWVRTKKTAENKDKDSV